MSNLEKLSEADQARLLDEYDGVTESYLGDKYKVEAPPVKISR